MHGKLRTVATVLGGMVASLTLLTLSAIGLGAIVASSNALFQAIKWAGAIYLVVLGILLWRSPVQELQHTVMNREDNSQKTVRLFALLRQGFTVGIANPKDLLFFGALFPQFLETSQPLTAQISVLAATWLAIDGAAMLGYATLGSKLSQSLGRLKGGKVFNRIAGSSFIVAGGALARVQQ